MKITMMLDESEYRESLDSLKACNFCNIIAFTPYVTNCVVIYILCVQPCFVVVT